MRTWWTVKLVVYLVVTTLKDWWDELLDALGKHSGGFSGLVFV